MSIGVLGCGRLGGLMVRYLSKDFKVLVHDPRPLVPRIRALGGAPASLEEACGQDVVIVCVPIRDFEETLRRMRPHLKPGTLVADTCSVKVVPAGLMRRLLPLSVELLAAHPSFGPDSAAESLEGRKLILCPLRVRTGRYARIKRYLRGRGLTLIEASPREHDLQMARSLVLTHYIGRGLLRIKARDLAMDTEGYRRLMRILATVQNDSWDLFEDMNRFNPYAASVRKRWIAALRALDARLSARYPRSRAPAWRG